MSKTTVYGRDRWELLDFLIERCQQIAWPGRA